MIQVLGRGMVLAAVALGAGCMSGAPGDPRPVDMPVSALRAAGGVSAAAAGEALREAGSRLVLVMGPADPAWYPAVQAAAGMEHMTRPAELGPDVGVAFLGLEPVGDTLMALRHSGAATFHVHDALYDLGRDRLVDLLSFRVETGAEARPLVTALSEYMATDVPPGAAVVMAVAVPSRAVGDSVAMMLGPMYSGVVGCGADAGAVAGAGIRLFYGPAARMYCTGAEATTTAAGDRVRADLVVGRQR
jgi:hypothetical protein